MMKRTQFYGLAASMLLAVMPVTAQTQKDVEKKIDLSGSWQTDLGAVHLPGTMDEAKLTPRAKEPYTTANLTRLYPYTGKMSYTRMIEIPTDWNGKPIFLTMEKTKPSTVWIDSDSIGSFTHLQAPHVYDLTGRLTPGKHRLRIVVDNRDEAVPEGVRGSHAWTDATQTNWNGVLGLFQLEAKASKYIQSVRVMPDWKRKVVLLQLELMAQKPGKSVVSAVWHSFNTSLLEQKGSLSRKVTLKEGANRLEWELDLGEAPLLWSEFNPALYQLEVKVQDKKECDVKQLHFGLRDFKTQGSQFTINGIKTILRGTHDGCVFPLTGYAPMTTEGWMHYFRILKQYGFNHVRFHSWTPSEAAFDAADRLGLYLQPELPLWGTIDDKHKEQNDYVWKEGEEIIKAYGNHPSFTQFALGNELWGDIDYMRRFLDHYREMDPRRLYAFGSNNMLGYKGYQKGEDFYVTCRVGGDVDSTYATHVRSSFSFADAWQGGLINGCYPNTEHTYEWPISHSEVPVVSHESGQFQVYPDYDQIKNYTGVLYPYNLEIFRDRLRENGLTAQQKDFSRATAAFSAICYKEDVEMCLRTPGFGGFQILDIKDYPGQGSALVGILDAFLNNKGGITADEFCRFNQEIVPMAEFSTYCWSNDQSMTGKVVVSNYSLHSLQDAVLKLSLWKNDEQLYEQSYQQAIEQGSVQEMGRYSIPLSGIHEASQLKLRLQLGNRVNEYKVWVYPESDDKDDKKVSIVRRLDEKTLKALQEGASILYVPEEKEIDSVSVGGLFTPDYWNYAMFKSISEGLKREVSPGTLSVLVNPEHPLFKDFPTEMHSDWQWWTISRHSRPLILNGTPADYHPLVQVIDNVERNHKLGILSEFKVGKGRILICTCQLNDIQDKPEGRQFRRSILKYMQSDSFQPSLQLTVAELTGLFHRSIDSRQIIGVKNITSYE